MARLAEEIDAGSCPFCAIVAGRLESDIVAGRDHAVAFLDRSPVFKGHVLVVPRTHALTIDSLPSALLSPLFALVAEVARAMRAGLGADGSFVAVNNRVSQSVAHLHVHVVPRHPGDGLRGFLWPRQRYAAGEREDYAQRLRGALTGG